MIVDSVFREGLFYIAIANVSSMPALDVAIKFDKPFRGLAADQYAELACERVELE